MRTLIAIPCMDMMHTLFVKSLLSMRITGEVEISFATSSLVYDARNALTRQALEKGFDRVLWLDSDMEFAPDTFEKLSARLDEGYDFVSGLYFKRKEPYEPVIYSFCNQTVNDQGITIPANISYLDYPKDSFFEIKGSGFGGVMLTTELLHAVSERFGPPFMPADGFGEDMAFCRRVQAIGRKMMCDSSVKMGHVGFKIITEKDWGDVDGK